MTRLAQVFWTVAVLDAVMLAAFLLMTLEDRAGRHDGGREMALFFFILLPALVLATAMLVFHFSTSLPVKAVTLFVVFVPALFYARQQIEDRLIDRRIEANRSGAGYFDSDAMRQMGVAVVRRDVDTLMRIGPTVDVNTPGRDTTLLALAVSGPDARTSDGSEMPVVRALLALGAKADAAMEVACIRADSTLLQTLLAAGGNPNLMIAERQPLVFSVMSSITPANFRLLARHGLDLNSRSYDDPLPVQLVIHRRWDLLLVALELGADMTRARPDGRTVAGELASQFAEQTSAEEASASRNVPADLQRAHIAVGQAH
jgi:hypothetical protein